MAKRQTATEPIKDAVSLSELKSQSEILFPDMTTMLNRYGLGDSIGKDYTGTDAVSVETAAEFLTRYDEDKAVKSAKWSRYQEYLQERRAKLAQKRREKAQKQREAFEAQQKKLTDQARKDAARKLAAIEAAAAKSEEAKPLSFSEWERKNG